MTTIDIITEIISIAIGVAAIIFACGMDKLNNKEIRGKIEKIYKEIFIESKICGWSGLKPIFSDEKSEIKLLQERIDRLESINESLLDALKMRVEYYTEETKIIKKKK